MPRLILQGTFGAHGGRPYAGCDAVHAARPAGSGLLPAGGRPPVAQAWAPGALVHDRAPGQPLDPQTRREMEDLYGESFAGVSIHHSIEPCSLGARAVTLGERIYFAPGEYQPQSSRGAVLLGRELSHVSQQRQLVAARRCDRVPIIRHPWLEAEASYRGSELLARRGRSQPQVVMRSSSKLKVGVAVGGLVLGTIALYALGKYLWSAWSSQGSQQPPRDNPANTMDPFQLAWSATQADARTDLPALGDVLIISEAGPEKDRTGRLVIEVSTSITRTYYPDFWFRKNSSKLDDSWLVWDWTSGDFPARRSFDTIIARSMICACEDEHFEGGLGPQAQGAAISTCGGIGPDLRGLVLARVLQLLRPGGRAIFTVSRQGGMSRSARTAARRKTREYWSELLSQLSGGKLKVRCVEVFIPSGGHGDVREPEGEFFGFVIYRDE